MRVPLSWLRDYVDLPEDIDPELVGAALVRAGLEVERVEVIGADVTGVVIGQVLSFDAEPQKNGKTVRWCQVEVGEPEPRGIVCGAGNFAVGDKVAVALPGSVLPGPFPITARKTYGHVSDGMICSARELGLGDDHDGILVLPPDSVIGDDVVAAFGLRDAVLDIAVTPDRSYCLSVRGVAREAATAFGLPYRDLALVPAPVGDDEGYPVVVLDTIGCDRYTARTISGIDPTAVSPMWLQRRLIMAGMRPVSLVVDVTNHVMLDLGQPLHAFDRDQLVGAITVRAAEPGERITTLDGVDRVLAHSELLICDDKGPVALAGVMGGRRAECSPTTTSIVLESAHFAAVPTARAARRHKLPSEASKRYERGVDHALAPSAAQAAVDLLVRLAGATADPGSTDVDNRGAGVVIAFDPAYPGRLAGRDYAEVVVRRRLADVGCTVAELEGGWLEVVPPSWRPDLTHPADLVEEVVRLEGYDEVPAVLPRLVAGRGLTRTQRLRRTIGRALAAEGFVETLAYPFMGDAVLDAMGLAAGDELRQATRLVNPISDDDPYLRTALLPGLLTTLVRNVGRGARDAAVFESGLVFGPPRGEAVVEWPGVDSRPSAEQLAALNAVIPDQRLHVAVALAPAPGTPDSTSWWGSGRPPPWAEVIEVARTVAAAAGVALEVVKDQRAPYHPGRCASLHAGGQVVGYAGELHPRAVLALGLPPRSAAMELDLVSVFAVDTAEVSAPALSTFPEAGRDVAVVVPTAVPVADVQAALASGAGPLLESIALFDVYVGGQVPAGHRSLAFSLKFRAPDRTLTDDEVNAARDTALAVALERTGAILR
ncbi:phenylalanine--tRNA ligase subunit beta [Acidothermaceae bacterium B102]|nr:phenylalanine--tRNA ligase subunit beta [Acidothermaceae bacterium B102]